MICPLCKSKATKNGPDENGIQKYRCVNPSCERRNFTENDPLLSGDPAPPTKVKIGMTLNEFRDKHDIEHIITKTLSKLRPDLIYEKNDIVKLAALSFSAPGLTTILDSKTLYYGKTGSKIYYSHPDTIKALKEQAKLM
jgi:transposase-like protein